MNNARLSCSNSLLLPRVCFKFVLELRLGCLVEFLRWSANIAHSDLISRPFFPHRPSSFRCAFFTRLQSILIPFRRAHFARLLVFPVSVASHVARSNSGPSRFRFVLRCSLEFPCFLCLPPRWAHNDQRSTSAFVGHCLLDDFFWSFRGLYYRLSTDCVLVPFCAGFVLRGLDLFGVCIK